MKKILMEEWDPITGMTIIYFSDGSVQTFYFTTKEE